MQTEQWKQTHICLIPLDTVVVNYCNVIYSVQIEEWVNRRPIKGGYTVVSVKQHKTGSHEVASFVLSSEEEAVSKTRLIFDFSFII